MDVHVPYAISTELRLRGIDILTAQADGTSKWKDSRLLDRASLLGRVLFTFDEDLLAEASPSPGDRCGLQRTHFTGTRRNVTIGRCVLDLELIARACEPEEWINRVEYLPLA
jgi:hypothetical protein